MVTERDVWAVAKMLVDQYGADATFQAAMRADQLLDRGDLDGQAVWMRILSAVKELLSFTDAEIEIGTGALRTLALKLVDLFGTEAEQYAAERAQRLEADGRASAAVVWRAIEVTIRDQRPDVLRH